jgi:hypothetical protein
MWSWLNRNAPAVQALSALLVLLVTMVLSYLTWRYVQLTRKISETSLRQLSASSQPSVSLQILGYVFIAGNHPLIVTGTVGVNNLGNAPFKIRSLSVVIRFRTASEYEQTPYPIKDIDGLVVIPDKVSVQNFRAETNISSNQHDGITLAIAMDCTDLAGVSQHSFFFDPNLGLRHFIGFRKPASWRARAWKRVRKITAMLKRWGDVDDAMRSFPEDFPPAP